jgi:hypothetical protein
MRLQWGAALFSLLSLRYLQLIIDLDVQISLNVVFLGMRLGNLQRQQGDSIKRPRPIDSLGELLKPVLGVTAASNSGLVVEFECDHHVGPSGDPLAVPAEPGPDAAQDLAAQVLSFPR